MPWSWKSRAIPLIPYGPYGLCRASVSVQGWPLPFFSVSTYISRLLSQVRHSNWKWGIFISCDCNIFPARTVKSYKRTSSTAPLNFNLNPRLRWAVNFKYFTLSLRWASNRQRSGPQRPHGLLVGGKKILFMPGIELPTP